ncbi:hypothetical protein [Roseibium aggregatum]|uniref:Uncharacterized protein n=1 Tax=Roseibium aggregatum TaxID=187304 RepID=A0A0M6XXX1_9HYPH|nr:hypothetical protein [Roseibium aggregatum]CTQ42701.1 hypothetical protein LAL4801_01137 [Roseibium aggregatum]
MSKGVAVLEREVEAHSSKADELSDLIDKKRSDLVAIRGCQGQAMLDGEPYDSSAAVELTSELDVLESAFSEATRRLRTAQSELREQRTAEVHKRIRNLETEQLVAIARAETAARELLETFQAAHNLTEELREAMDRLGFRRGDISQDGLQERLSRRLTATLKPLLVRGWRRYGAIEFPEPRDCDVVDWVEDEKRIISAHVENCCAPDI